MIITRLSFIALFALMSGSVWAQESNNAPDESDDPAPQENTEDELDNLFDNLEDYIRELEKGENGSIIIPDENIPDVPDITPVPAALEAEPDKPEEIRTAAQRAAKLDELFAELQKTRTDADAELIVEEIWALWQQSGSASVDLLMRRGIEAHAASDYDLARRMYDHVLRLQPDFAEAWSRSGTLAYEQQDYELAARHVTESLSLEPRHFYALWIMGNIFEQAGMTDAAYEAYTEAVSLHPMLEPVLDRLDYIREEVEGPAM